MFACYTSHATARPITLSILAASARARRQFGCLLLAILALAWASPGKGEGEGEGSSTFSLRASSADGGGAVSNGGGYDLTTTVGQADAGLMTGGTFRLRGGVWASRPQAQPTSIFADGFESGDASAWSATAGGP